MYTLKKIDPAEAELEKKGAKELRDMLIRAHEGKIIQRTVVPDVPAPD